MRRHCPGWEGNPTIMWLIVLATSLSSPLMVALTLRFLRGTVDDEEDEPESPGPREERASSLQVGFSLRPAPPRDSEGERPTEGTT